MDIPRLRTVETYCGRLGKPTVPASSKIARVGWQLRPLVVSNVSIISESMDSKTRRITGAFDRRSFSGKQRNTVTGFFSAIISSAVNDDPAKQRTILAVRSGYNRAVRLSQEEDKNLLSS